MKHTVTAYTTGPWKLENGTLKAPVVMMVEGVHHGSMGRIYWAPHVLRSSVSKWDGIPVCIDHPQYQGNFVSIKHPAVSSNAIGAVRNPYFCEQKKGIRAEIHVPGNHPRKNEIQRAKEVSVGVFSDETFQQGIWNNESFEACAITMEPDHLAILPNETGACSWADGCGIRVNNLNNMKGIRTMPDYGDVPGFYEETEEEELDTLEALLAFEDENDVLLPMGMKFEAHARAEKKKGKPETETDYDDVPLPIGVE